MMTLVDTSVWSLAFRRRSASALHAQHLADLINRREVAIIGPIRQELLSGIRDSTEFSRIRHRMRAFPDLSFTEEHFERAAEFFNICRSQGVQGSNTDFLICAVADINSLAVFTTDRDFHYFARYLPVRLYHA